MNLIKIKGSAIAVINRMFFLGRGYADFLWI